MFIVFEGPDGSGTSTQAKRLAEYYANKHIDVLHTAEPSSSSAGILLREILTHKKTLSATALQILFFADRMHHIEKQIMPALQNGSVVICERYNWSTISYGIASGVDETLLKNLASFFPFPDITIFMDLPASQSLKRIEQRGMAKEYFEKTDILQRVQKTMQHLAEKKDYSKSVLQCNAQKSVETLASEIRLFCEKHS